MFAIASLLALIFSLFVISSTNIEVLINSPLCAKFNIIGHSLYTNLWSRITNLATAYADDCYKNTTLLLARCNIFTKPNILIVTEATICLFTRDICLSSAILFDSGRQDINDAFGFNLADKDRVMYCKRTTCALLS